MSSSGYGVARAGKVVAVFFSQRCTNQLRCRVDAFVQSKSNFFQSHPNVPIAEYLHVRVPILQGAGLFGLRLQNVHSQVP